MDISALLFDKHLLLHLYLLLPSVGSIVHLTLFKMGCFHISPSFPATPASSVLFHVIHGLSLSPVLSLRIPIQYLLLNRGPTPAQRVPIHRHLIAFMHRQLLIGYSI